MVCCNVITMIILFYVMTDTWWWSMHFFNTHLNCVRIPPTREYAEFELFCIDIIQDQ